MKMSKVYTYENLTNMHTKVVSKLLTKLKAF